MIFKLSYLNLNIALTLDYLNPALNNSALDNTKEIRDAMLDQVVWKDFIRTARDDSRLK